VESSVSFPHIVIIGGGFGGLAAARALGNAPVRITLVDSRNHHLFQPLLYQVATAALNASDIARPIRRILRRQANSEVILGETESIDRLARKVILDDGEIGYDYLIIASGAGGVGPGEFRFQLRHWPDYHGRRRRRDTSLAASGDRSQERRLPKASSQHRRTGSPAQLRSRSSSRRCS
jgi:NADH dehydrogenase FAD-containing subunit